MQKYNNRNEVPEEYKWVTDFLKNNPKQKFITSVKQKLQDL